jgi:hypothetical protein
VTASFDGTTPRTRSFHHRIVDGVHLLLDDQALAVFDSRRRLSRGPLYSYSFYILRPPRPKISRRGGTLCQLRVRTSLSSCRSISPDALLIVQRLSARSRVWSGRWGMRGFSGLGGKTLREDPRYRVCLRGSASSPSESQARNVFRLGLRAFAELNRRHERVNRKSHCRLLITCIGCAVLAYVSSYVWFRRSHSNYRKSSVVPVVDISTNAVDSSFIRSLLSRHVPRQQI